MNAHNFDSIESLEIELKDLYAISNTRAQLGEEPSVEVEQRIREIETVLDNAHYAA